MWGSGKYLEQWWRWETVNAELRGLGTWGEPCFLSALCHRVLEVRSCLWHHGLLVHWWKLWTSFLKKYTNVHFAYNSGPFYVCFQKTEVSWLLSANTRISMENFKNKIKFKNVIKSMLLTQYGRNSGLDIPGAKWGPELGLPMTTVHKEIKYFMNP